MRGLTGLELTNKYRVKLHTAVKDHYSVHKVGHAVVSFTKKGTHYPVVAIQRGWRQSRCQREARVAGLVAMWEVPVCELEKEEGNRGEKRTKKVGSNVYRTIDPKTVIRRYLDSGQDCKRTNRGRNRLKMTVFLQGNGAVSVPYTTQSVYLLSVEEMKAMVVQAGKLHIESGQ